MSTTETTVVVEDNATQASAIDLTTTQLLGLFGGGETPRAMLRGGDGTILMVQPDEATDLGEVVAITDSYVLLRQENTIHRLTIPT